MEIKHFTYCIINITKIKLKICALMVVVWIPGMWCV